jgi:hypothetical protein
LNCGEERGGGAGLGWHLVYVVELWGCGIGFVDEYCRDGKLMELEKLFD